MKTVKMTVAEFKSRFTEALATVSQGHCVAITYGRARRPVALLTSPPKAKPQKRRLGKFSHKLQVRFSQDWKMTDEEFLKT